MANLAFLTERMRLGFGVDLVVDQVATGLAERGHDVTVYASFEDGTYRDRPYELVPFAVPAIKYAPLYDLEAARRAKRFGLAARGHELFFIATPPFFALLPWLRERAVAIDCGVVDSAGFPPAVRANFTFLSASQHHVYFRYASRILPISEFLRGSLPASLQPKATTVLLGADHHPLAPAEASKDVRARLGVGADEVLLLYLGRLNPSGQPYKGTAQLLSLYEQLRAERPSARLVLAGFGDAEDEAWARAGGAIPWTNVPVADLPALLGAADLFVTCSKWEGFNLNVVEAQRAGTPVIAYKVGAHPEVVEDGASGLLVHSERGFLDAMRELVDDPARRAQMAGRAVEWAGRFRWADTVARYDEVVATALGRHPARADGP